MRGKDDAEFEFMGNHGITPAYAGKRDVLHLTHDFTGDHPRVCGEKRCVGFAHGYRLGSPPRMRGKENVTGQELGRTRITPAYAGKS